MSNKQIAIIVLAAIILLLSVIGISLAWVLTAPGTVVLPNQTLSQGEADIERLTGSLGAGTYRITSEGLDCVAIVYGSHADIDCNWE